ncbi:MAG: hypothetical protein LC104_01825 [Bacteroidales bacterium]|nr:hypothetical protein [Bacteroidales bacterium]
MNPESPDSSQAEAVSTPSVPSASAPLLDITLEEWIAASQACCGRDPVDETLPPTATSD